MKNYTLQSSFQQQSIMLEELDELDDFATFLNKDLVDESNNEEAAHLNKATLLNCAHKLYQKLSAYQLFDIQGNSQRYSLLENKLWSYQPLKSTELFQLGFLTIYNDTNIPLHDHPGSYGFQYVIDGYVQIQQYQHASAKKTKQSISFLKKIAEYNLKKGDISLFQPFVGNIHKMTSISKNSVLLTMQLHPYKAQQRSWYFPINFLPDSKETLFNRVQARSTKY